MKKKKHKSDKEIAYEEKYKKYITSYKTIKTSLKSIIKDEYNITKIENAVFRMHSITTHTYQFLKLYCLHQLENNGTLPEINEKLINSIMKILCIKSNKGSKPSNDTVLLKTKLTKFYNDHYKELLPNELNISYTNLNTVFDYEKVGIFTCIKTHISEHFQQCMNRYINVIADKDKNIENINNMKFYDYDNNINNYINGKSTIINSKEIKKERKLDTVLKKKMISVYTKELNVLKRDIMMNEDLCDSKYNSIKAHIRKNILDNLFDDYVNKVLDDKLNDIYNTIDNCKEINCNNDYKVFIDNNEIVKGKSILNDELKEYIKEYNLNKYNTLKNDIIGNNKKISKENQNIKTALIKTYKNNNIYKKLDNDPLSLLHALIKISMNLEKNEQKIMTSFPLRRSIIPSYIKLDTTSIIRLIFPKELNKDYYLRKGNTKKLGDEIWGSVFKTNAKIFKNNKYRFCHQIETDGIGCSILLIRKDLYNPNKKTKIHNMKKPTNYRSEQYVTDLTDEEKKEILKLNVVANDPGKSDLMYTTNGKKRTTVLGKEKFITFKYTQTCRRQETKKGKYSKIRENDKKGEIIKCDNIGQYKDYLDTPFSKWLDEKGAFEAANYSRSFKTVKELETLLSSCNSKSCNYENTKEYIKIKNYLSDNLMKYYQKDLYRKLKWYSYINIQKSEARLVNRLKSIYGSPSKTVLFFGNYGGGNLKNCEPTKGKGLRKVFRNAGYRLFLVDEYNTTKKNYVNGIDNEKFLWRRNPRPYKQGVTLVHGLLRSKTIKSGKSSSNKHILVNRNLNGSMNILKIVNCVLTNTSLPPYLIR